MSRSVSTLHVNTVYLVHVTIEFVLDLISCKGSYVLCVVPCLWLGPVNSLCPLILSSTHESVQSTGLLLCLIVLHIIIIFKASIPHSCHYYTINYE